jgi:hypothetical protein
MSKQQETERQQTRLDVFEKNVTRILSNNGIDFSKIKPDRASLNNISQAMSAKKYAAFLIDQSSR